ncbi:MAG: flagellar hook-basal body complex protein, partial [Clostridiaceae bacterium]
MLRSMSSVVSGLSANQTALDVIGNNIANVSTTSFKQQRVRFSDNISQSISDAISPSTTLGGSNPKQVGLGTTISGIDTIVTQGSLTPTTNKLDCAVDGDGYFMVSKSSELFDTGTTGSTTETIGISLEDHTIEENPREAEIFYTRDGSFSLDQDGNLINSDGYRVLGYSLIDTTTGNKTIQSIGDKGNVSFVDANAVDDNEYSTVRAYVSGTGNANDEYEYQLKTLKIPDTVRCPKDDGTTFDPNTDGAYKDVRVKSYSIESSGLIKAALEDGNTTIIGQMALSSFNNPAGLYRVGGNLLQESENSGDASLMSAYFGYYDSTDAMENLADGASNTGAFGSIRSGALEGSN